MDREVYTNNVYGTNTGSRPPLWVLVGKDLWLLTKIFVCGWLMLLGAWNSLVVPYFEIREMSPLMSALLIAGGLIGMTLFGDAK